MERLGYPDNVHGFYKKYFGSGPSEKLRTIFHDFNEAKTEFLVELTEKVVGPEGEKLNGHWLLTGIGEPFFKDLNQESYKSDKENNRYQDIIYLNQLIDEKDERLKEKEIFIKEQEDHLNDKQKLINTLEELLSIYRPAPPGATPQVAVR